jgi:hypothetical protein
MNTVMPCKHPKLHVEIRAMVIGEKQIRGSFIVCTDCNSVISYMPPTSPAPPQDNRIDKVAYDVSEIEKHIININNTLKAWAKKP